jgi:hypothetical protein
MMKTLHLKNLWLKKAEKTRRKATKTEVPVEAKSPVEKTKDGEEMSSAAASHDGPLDDGKEEEGELEDVAPRVPRVTVIRLDDGERRGFWSDHELPKTQSIQAFMHGAVNDVDLPLMLDTGANISILHTNRLGIGVKMFADPTPTSFYGVSLDPVGAHGLAKVEIRLGGWVVFETDVWVADFDAQSLVILGTDFMIRAGVVVDLKNRICTIPKEDPLSLLTYESMKSPRFLKEYEKVRGATKKKLRWLSKKAVYSIGDVPPAIFALVLQPNLTSPAWIKRFMSMKVSRCPPKAWPSSLHSSLRSIRQHHQI